MGESSRKNDKRTSYPPQHSLQRSETPAPRSRPHSAAELYYPPPQGFRNLGEFGNRSARGGPRILDASRHGTVVEDDLPHRSSSLRASIVTSSNSVIGLGSSSGQSTQPPDSSGPSPSKRSSAMPMIRDEWTLTEESPYPDLAELTVPTPGQESAEDDGDDLYDDTPSVPRSRAETERGRAQSRHGRRRSRGSSNPNRSHRSSRTYDPEHRASVLVAPAREISSPSPGGLLDATLEEGEQLSPAEVEQEQNYIPPPSWTERVFQQLFTLSYLVFFSIFGTLARLGLQWLTFYPGAPTALAVLWANFAGSLLMGFFAEDRTLFRQADRISRPDSQLLYSPPLFARRPPMTDVRFSDFLKTKRTIPLYIGLTTGFCGSLTSFSSFMRDTFLALSNDLRTPYNQPTSTPHSFHAAGPTVPRNDGYSVMSILAVIILTVCLSISALKIGCHLALFTERLPLPLRIFGNPKARAMLDYTMPVIALGSWLGAVFLAIWPPDRPDGPAPKGSTWAAETWRGDAIFACVFAPLGCIVRFYALVHMNHLQPAFPLGTFAVNVFGTAVLGMAWDLQHVPLQEGALVGGGRVGCQVLQGIMDGFCGALTTVSTWVVELDGLGRRRAWVYGGASVGVGLGLLVAIMGSVRWSVGWSAPVCAL